MIITNNDNRIDHERRRERGSCRLPMKEYMFPMPETDKNKTKEKEVLKEKKPTVECNY